jgi:hypothetical protein
MLRSALVVLLLGVGATDAAAWWDQNWTKRVKLSILNSGQAEAFVGFPLLVRLDGSRINYADTLNAGQDVRFVDADDTTPLAHEIELWNEAGSSFVWVKVPQIDASSDADFIWMYYGNPVASDAQNPAGVWDTDFKMVHHLKETSGAHFDSTSNNNDSVGIEITTQGSGAGQINGADVFSGTDDIEIADSATLDIGAAESFTVEAWVKTTLAAGQQMVVCKQDGTTQYQIWTDDGNAKFWLVSGVTVHAQSATSVANNQWRYVVGRWNEATSTAEVFVDGVSVASASNAALGAMSNARPLRIGEEADSDPEGGFNFLGTIDEVRLSKVARSNNWIRAQNLSMRDSFVSFGAPSPQGVMRVKSGSYTGNAADNRPIFVGFQPDVVIVDMDAAVDVAPNEAVIRTSVMAGDVSKDLDGPNAFASDKVQSLDPTGFTIGADPTVNESGRAYHWVAFTAAATKLHVGSYVGDGVTDNRSISGIGFQPEYVMVLPGSTARASHRSSAIPGDVTYQFASPGFADGIQALETDGFQVGLDARVNASGVTYYYAAWNVSPGETAVGVYTGDGAPSRNITGVGFFPEYVIVNRSGLAFRATHKPASTGVSNDRSLIFESRLGEADNIEALLADGFRVGGNSRVNSATAPNDYFWVAFGPHVPKTYLRSIGDLANTYGTGTVSVTNGLTSVGGVGGPNWVVANRGRGDAITIPCGNPPTCTGGVHYTIAQVLSPTSLELTDPYQGATSGSITYLIRRQFADPATWENCIDGGGTSCGLFPSVPSSLVTDDRREIGILYEDLVYPVPLDGVGLRISGAITDAEHTITVTADGINRHYGIPGAGVQFQINPASTSGDAIEILTRYVTVEWMEVYGGSGADGIEVTGTSPAAGKVIVRNNLLHDLGGGIQAQDGLADVDIYNNIIFSTAKEGIDIDVDHPVRILNNTVYNTNQQGIYAAAASNPSVILRNNLVHTNGNPSYAVPGLSPLSSHNLSGPADATATSHSPAGGGRPNVSLAALAFVDPVSASKNLHLLGTSFAIDKAADSSGVFTSDIDFGNRLTPWDIGADDAAAATRVKLASFEAIGVNGAVELRWETGSELDNLGFHLHRSESESEPYERVTSRLIPGLGTSPEGARYRYVDSGLSNGTTYFYKLEDVETSGKKRFHGPVSATPSSSTMAPSESSSISFGNSEANGFRILSRSSRALVLELTTEGFTAEPQEDGSVLLQIPGFDRLDGSPSVPVLRPWVDVLAGREVRITSIQTSRVESLAGLRPSGAEVSGVVATTRGTVRARRGRARAHAAAQGLVPAEWGRLLQVGFQGGTKKAQLELAPLRWDGVKGELVLARTLTVHLDFGARVAQESGRRSRSARSGAFARLVTTERGLHEVPFEALFSRGRGVSVDTLRLSRLGEPVAIHVEPRGRSFGPGSKLYFLSDAPGVNPYGRELVYELEMARGPAMGVASAAPSGENVGSYLVTESHEENRYYQAALLDAPDLWLWDVLLAPVTKSYPFSTRDLAPGPARLTVWLQGVTDFDVDPDHRVRLYVNGTLQSELEWNGKRGERVVLELPAGMLREGDNALELESAGNTGAPYSMVMLDRFELTYPRASIAWNGELDGLWMESGTASLEGLGPAFVLDVTDRSPRWLAGSASGFAVDEGRRYLAVSTGSVKRPEVRPVEAPRLSREANRADYLVIGPRAFAPAAAALLEHRERQGLRVKFAATEEIASEFGFGEPRPEAIRDFIAFAYHEWRAPQLRYVLLLGDATYDYKDYLKTGVRNEVPSLLVKTSYLWTASDPALAAVNGDDILPDVAIGRLPAASPEELRVMVEKILSYEAGTVGLDELLVLVSDNPDLAGDFDSNAREIARGLLSGRDVRHLSLTALGSSARAEILSSFDQGASLLSYIGHGGIHLWADENVFNTGDVSSLSPQSRQPLLVTMNCLNGYFHFPYFDSLAESLVKVEGRGAIAAFSPSGLSLDAPAHRFHVALLDALFREAHPRLGDAVVSAQSAYAASGVFPELISIYHLLGDPALVISPGGRALDPKENR